MVGDTIGPSESQIDGNASGLLKSMIDGYRLSQMIHVVAKLRVADLLAAGPMTIDELAGATAAHSESLGRILRALASFGTFSEDPDAVLKSQPEVRGILFDEASVVVEAQARCGSLEVGRRCSFMPGSFFLSIPTGANTYLLKDILHDWDDQHAIDLLRKLRATMPRLSRLLVIERLIAPDNQPSASKALDIVMLVLTGGKERARETILRSSSVRWLQPPTSRGREFGNEPHGLYPLMSSVTFDDPSYSVRTRIIATMSNLCPRVRSDEGWS
jgi:hypothetical protein